MLYLTIPQGWRFEQKEIEGVLKDVYMNESSNDQIVIQDLVKATLRNKRRHETFRVVNNEHVPITIYFRSPPRSGENFLKYEPNKNGKEPSTNVVVVQGNKEQKKSPASYTCYGQFWANNACLSKEKRAEIEEKRTAQRVSRQHQGNSPMAT